MSGGVDRARRPRRVSKVPVVDVRSMHSPLPGWTEDQALELARQGYSADQVERMTGFAAAWIRARTRRPGQP